MTEPTDCPFCQRIALPDLLAESELAVAFKDAFPVSQGHALIVSRRHVADFFELTGEEQAAIWRLLPEVKTRLEARHAPAGYNVGVNVRAAAGQTVGHVHVHLIPRYPGDMDDPRGGVRHVIPWKGNYARTSPEPLSTGGEADPFLAHLLPLWARAETVDIVAAFVQDSGLELLERAVVSLVARGGRLRLLTGDYLNITQAEALKRMLDWQSSWPATTGAGFTARVIETACLPGASRSFHPKSWIFCGPCLGVAFVGSSNVSRSALMSGIEWNLRLDRCRDAPAYDRIASAFELLWPSAQPLTFEWLSRYAERARLAAAPLPPGDAEPEAFEPAPQPHEVQEEALAALAETRRAGRRRALVVMATGLGKTLVAALDAAQHRGERAAPRTRVLFVAHRRELLGQAAETFRRVLRPDLPGLSVGWFAEDRSELEADVVVASVQKLSRPENLALLAGRPFDYVVVDEVHHADAASYRKVLDRLDAGFVLGLTATPDRADEGDILGLFDDNLVFRADLDVGIEVGRLVPFAYFGLKDVVDYANIPWRNRRFDPEALAAAVQTQQRMTRLWQAWAEHPGSRTLVFCCSIPHAEHVARWLAGHGQRVAAVHSQPGSADRADSLRRLAEGQLDAICTVDLFNEGVDLPKVDRVVMLRPTESPVVFLQQLGRGLRAADGKDRLTVIDFVGNHRVFLDRVRTLLAFGGLDRLAGFLEGDGSAELPAGCSVEVELEAVELLRRLLPSGASEVERIYRELVAARGERPSMGELLRMGFNPRTLRAAHGSWFEFVRSEGHLRPDEEAVLKEAAEWFREVETTALSKSFKMVVLESLIEAEGLEEGLPLKELARRGHALLVRSPELFADLEGVKELPDPRDPAPRTWLAYWKKNPVLHWCGGAGGDGEWFRLSGDRFVPRLPIPAGHLQTFTEMTRELVDYRLSDYRQRRQSAATGDAFSCKVTWNKRDPILKLPPRGPLASVPAGETDVRLRDGAAWQFRFQKEFCNVARPAGTDRNRLPDLMREWFGPSAGRPGTTFSVRFYRSPDGWWVEPLGKVLELPKRGSVVAYPTLAAAAGGATSTAAAVLEPEEVSLPLRESGRDLFAVRATGRSMDGGTDPIGDGDWLVFRLARGAGLGVVEGRVALVQRPGEEADHAYQVKRVVKSGDGWVLRSDNADEPSYPATAATVPIALLVAHFHPEDLGPAPGTVFEEAGLANAFGIEGRVVSGRYRGHLVLVAAERGSLVSPRLVRPDGPARRPGETTFVLAREEGSAGWRYCGVGRWLDEPRGWRIPEVSYPTWRALGTGSSCSRELQEGALEEARRFVGAVMAEVGPGGWRELGGKRCRIVGTSGQGGLRIDGGSGGFQERTVSLTDLAWVLLAKKDVEEHGGVVDEARVNRLRYLEGTPRASTRWIDTRWAVVVVMGG